MLNRASEIYTACMRMRFIDVYVSREIAMHSICLVKLPRRFMAFVLRSAKGPFLALRPI